MHKYKTLFTFNVGYIFYIARAIKKILIQNPKTFTHSTSDRSTNVVCVLYIYSVFAVPILNIHSYSRMCNIINYSVALMILKIIITTIIFII